MILKHARLLADEQVVHDLVGVGAAHALGLTAARFG